MEDHETEKKQELTHTKAFTIPVQNQIPSLIMYIYPTVIFIFNQTE